MPSRSLRSPWFGPVSRMLLLLTVTLAGPLGARADERDAPSPAALPATAYTIRGMRAFPWYHHLGRFGEEDILSGKFALWNVIGGAGDVQGPTEATLVVVQVDGPSFLAGISGEVAITARTRKATLATTRIPFSSLFAEEAHTVYVPMLVQGTGCEFVTVTAAVTFEKKTVSTQTRTIEFRCGE